ncbi:hypothetical protein J4217_04360 [Candidatus Pacearchaeota archaeon]|nr:hypothetical protein [Candidatus Pacearchaeota archaeon]
MNPIASILGDTIFNDWLKVAFIIIIGVLLAFGLKFLFNKLAKKIIYPWIRRTSPENYKQTVSGTMLLSAIIYWFVLIIFILIALSVLNIDILAQITSKIINFVPKIAIAFGVILIGLLITSVISRKIKDQNFRTSLLLARIFEIIFISATILSALEVINIKLTPFEELFRVLLYTIGLTVAIALGISLGFALKPEIVRMVKGIRRNSHK